MAEIWLEAPARRGRGKAGDELPIDLKYDFFYSWNYLFLFKINSVQYK
ncbi:MAG: hypothetical protein IH950_00475 [Bacteroidetes bacterium]|nr:hypothetical protein [Bacteroidota bacterium]